jgi:F0F1-type ATP synthase membrane subunit c/vacuolar-type H+-ATPase subunit K
MDGQRTDRAAGKSENPMTRVGSVAIVGAICGFLLVTAAVGFFTGSNLAGLVGIIFGIPIGIIEGVIAGAIWSKERRSGNFFFWYLVSAVMVIFLLVVAIIMYMNWKNGVAS